MERDARTRNGTSNSLHIDVANCNLCYGSHYKLKSCSMHFDKKQNRYHPIAYKGKTEPTTVAERYGKLSPTKAPGNKKGILISFLHKR
jgi:hypothetical protein